MPGKISIAGLTAVLAAASVTSMQAHARDTRYDLPIAQALAAPEAAVDGQNSWELGGMEMGVFKDYLEESDKIDGSWV